MVSSTSVPLDGTVTRILRQRNSPSSPHTELSGVSRDVRTPLPPRRIDTAENSESHQSDRSPRAPIYSRCRHRGGGRPSRGCRSMTPAGPVPFGTSRCRRWSRSSTPNSPRSERDRRGCHRSAVLGQHDATEVSHDKLNRREDVGWRRRLRPVASQCDNDDEHRESSSHRHPPTRADGWDRDAIVRGFWACRDFGS